MAKLFSSNDLLMIYLLKECTENDYTTISAPIYIQIHTIKSALFNLFIKFLLYANLYVYEQGKKCVRSNFYTKSNQD